MDSWLGSPSVDVCQNININFLRLNYAYVILNTTLEHIGVYSVSEDCYRCPYQRLTAKYHADNTKTPSIYKVYTGDNTKWRILNYEHGEYIQDHYRSGLLCEMKSTLQEYGVYNLDIGRCIMKTKVPPVNIYLPLLFFVLIMLSASAASGLIKLFLRRKHNDARYNDGLNLTAKRDNSDIMPSLHFLRGFLLILIIFVTTGGGGYSVFSKSYGGLTVANCLLLAYTFTVGLKIPIMFNEESRNEKPRLSILGIVFLRSFVLFTVGCAIYWTGPHSRFLAAQLWAPIPCIAICYFVVAVSYMICTSKRVNKLKDINVTTRSLFWSWVFGAFLVIIMILSTYLFYFTECKQCTDFDPRRISWMTNGNNCEEDNVFSEVVNKNLLQVNRDEPFYVDYYYAYTKGLLGVISTILTALVGLKAGVIYLHHKDQDRIKQWCFLAAIFGVSGVIVAALSGPLNFNLWPLSTIFLISSMTIFVYIFIYYLTEVKQIFSDTIMTCGVASIATLSGHLLFSQNFPFYWGMYWETHFFYLWQSTWIVFLWVLITVCWIKWRTYLVMKFDEKTRCVILAW